MDKVCEIHFHEINNKMVGFTLSLPSNPILFNSQGEMNIWKWKYFTKSILDKYLMIYFVMSGWVQEGAAQGGDVTSKPCQGSSSCCSTRSRWVSYGYQPPGPRQSGDASSQILTLHSPITGAVSRVRMLLHLHPHPRHHLPAQSCHHLTINWKHPAK